MASTSFYNHSVKCILRHVCRTTVIKSAKGMTHSVYLATYINIGITLGPGTGDFFRFLH